MGDRVSPGQYFLHSRYRRVVNLVSGQKWVSLADPSVGAGPDTIVVFGVDLNRVDGLVIEEGAVSWNDDGSKTTISTEGVPRFISKMADWLVFPSRLDPQRFLSSISQLESGILARASQESLAFLLKQNEEMFLRTGFERALVRRLREAVGRIVSGDFRSGIARMRGLGRGLTPSGDDFLAGLLVAGHLLLPLSRQRSADPDWLANLLGLEWGVDRATEAGFGISGYFLERASSGYVCERWKNLLMALIAGRTEEIERAISPVLEMGSTSGADMAVGFVLGMKRGLYGC